MIPPNSASAAATGPEGDAATSAECRVAGGVFRPHGLDIRPERVLRVMGYRAQKPPRPAVVRIAEAMIEVLAAAMNPSLHYRRVPIEILEDSRLVLSEGTIFNGTLFRRHLAGCRDVVAFVLTLGDRLDSTQKNLVAGEKLLEAVLLETAGWLAIEEATRLFTIHLAESLKTEDLVLSRRLAPGYTLRVDDRKAEWPLEDQKALFTLFRDAAIPVALLDSCAMVPKMSRSGLFGLRPAMPRPPRRSAPLNACAE